MTKILLMSVLSCLSSMIFLSCVGSVSGSNVCEGVTCSDHGVCAVSASGALCACDEGYHAEGFDCIEDGSMNPCKDVDCSEHGVCAIEVTGDLVCVCDDGYHTEGLNCIEDGEVNPCEGIDCSDHGTCFAIDGSAVCHCDDGYHTEGLNCIEDGEVNPCEGVDCSAHGTCSAIDGSASCSCDDGYHSEGLSCVEDGGGYVPPSPPNATHFNRDYYDQMRALGRPTQETPWGFQEISLEGMSTHDVSSIAEYQSLVSNQASQIDGSYVWNDGGTHFVNFAAGTYAVTDPGTYYVMRIPSRTVIQGAGIGETVFVASTPTPLDRTNVRLFSIEKSDDVAIRNLSFYNETNNTRWSFLYAVDHTDGGVRENFLFENIEFDDSFGAVGGASGGTTAGSDFNFITLRGLRKRLGHTSAMIRANFTIPVPTNYQFLSQNSDGVHLAGQVGIRRGNSTVIHDCILGDNISATLDIYNNYVEIVGTQLIDPLHDHSIKNPNGNHLYVHDSSFDLTYTERLIRGGAYWMPTFLTHEGGALANYHLRGILFTRAGTIFEDGVAIPEGEVFQLYNNRPDNVSGDMVWEDISFSGYDNEIVGYPNVQRELGFQAINYTLFEARPGQSKAIEDRGNPDFSVEVDKRSGSSREDLTGVYSWGARSDGTIDFPRENRTFRGSKAETESRPYVMMHNASVSSFYNSLLGIRQTVGARSVPPGSPSATDLYASPDVVYGSDRDLGSDGSQANPMSLHRALSRVEPGQTVWLRGGVYHFSITGADPYYPTVSSNGLADARIVVEGYPGEHTTIEGTPSDWNVGSLASEHRSFRVQGDYVTLRNFEIRQNAAFGLYNEGDHVIVEGLVVHDNLLTGISNHGRQCIIRDNVSYGNSDYGFSSGAYDNGNNADGITSTLETDGTIIEHNTVYGNSDDGIDLFYARGVTVRFNRVYWNGRHPDGSDFVAADFRGNGQGIKTGGSGSQGNIIEHNISYKNKSHGVDISERDNIDCIWRYNTAWSNGGKGFYDLAGIGNDVHANIAHDNGAGPSNASTDEVNNSWQRSGAVEFISTDPVDPDFLRPVSGGGMEDIGAYANPG